MTTHQTTHPARREHQHQVPKLPDLFHILKYRDTDGTIYTLCGEHWKDTLEKATSAATNKITCPACHAAKHLYEVMP